MTQTDPQPALEVDQLSAGYEGATVLHDVSVRVPAGGVVAILGPNGAGKTTLLRAVSGFVRADRGRVLLSGRDVTQMRPHARAEDGIGHVPQGRGIYPSLTVRENLLVQCGRGDQSDAIESAVTAFPALRNRLGQRAGTMSGGQQQMLSLAAAHVRRPKVLVVDEPSLGLAPVVVDEIFEFLRAQAAMGVATVVVDQFATRALELAATAYVLRKGQVVYDGSAAGLLDEAIFDHYLGVESAPVR